MYETILGGLDALSASFGMIRKSQQVLPGENPWEYSGGASEGTSQKKEDATELLEKEANSNIKLVERTFKMVEKS